MSDKTVKLKNDMLTVEISALGAELQSVKSSKGTEFLWYGDKKIWQGRAPLLFPICGGLKDDKYIFNGKEYTLPKHGFARFSEFEVESACDTNAVFLLSSNNESLKYFPFDYELRIIYSLNNQTLDIKYEISNKSSGMMYFSIGAHEGYLCPEGIEEYSVVFNENETLKSSVLNGNLLENNTFTVLNDSNVLDLNYEYFSVDALVFKKINSKSVTLKHKKSSKEIKVDFKGFNYLLLWTKPNAPYICIEPWCGIPDGVDSNFDFTKKEGILVLGKGELLEKTHTITFID